MKCPECQNNQAAKLGLNCRVCGYKFTFNPKSSKSLGLTDGKFLALINKASKDGKLFFTDNQLYAAYVAGGKSRRAEAIIGLAFVAAAAVFFWRNFPLLSIPCVLLAAWLIWLIVVDKPAVLSAKKFKACVGEWLDSKKPIDKLIREPTLYQPPSAWAEPDIYDYGVERVLVVQRDVLVDLLVLNNQHAEQRMAVISENGYPQYLVPQIQRLLSERPELPVFLLHDADAKGAAMAERVRHLEWLPAEQHQIVDTGFFPSDFEKLKRTRNQRVVAGHERLPADALLMGALALGLGACFASQSTFADEIMREEDNGRAAGGSFG